MNNIFHLFKKYVDTKEPNLICCPLQPAIITSWPYPIWNSKSATCSLLPYQSCYCLSLLSIPDSVWKECWSSRCTPWVLLFVLSKYVPNSGPTALLNWRHSILADTFQRAGKWLCSYIVLWQVCILIAVSGSRHPDKGPSKWQGGMNSKRSRNTFFPQRTV